jgi:uncharacterized membrane protein
MSRLRALWWRISGGLWFVPSVMVLTAVVLALVLVEAEGSFGNLAKKMPRLFGAGAEGAREMLSAIAGSMITVAGVVFSVTLVALSLAASQYSPRVLRTFMSDKPTQVVLGVFVSVFAYCLIVLRTIRGEQEGSFVPSLAVLGGIALAFVAIGFLVFFIHHLATAIQVSTIVSRVTNGTLRTIEAVSQRPHSVSVDSVEQVNNAGGIDAWTPVMSSVSGYIVSVDYEQLVDYASARRRVLRMDRAIGDFVVRGQPIASLSGSEPAQEPDVRELNALYSTDTSRTLEQDPAFGIQQIVDIGLKALSPGINDETTAIMCIDRLTEIFARLAQHEVGPRCYFRGGGPVLLTATPDFLELVKLGVNPILACAGGKRRVLLRLVWLVEQTVAFATETRHAAAMKTQLDNIIEIAEATIAAYERAEVLTAARRVIHLTDERIGAERACTTARSLSYNASA